MLLRYCFHNTQRHSDVHLQNVISSTMSPRRNEETPLRHYSDVAFTKREVAVTFDLWPPKSRQFILESESTRVQNLKKIPQSVLEAPTIAGCGTKINSRWEVWNRIRFQSAVIIGNQKGNAGCVFWLLMLLIVNCLSRRFKQISSFIVQIDARSQKGAGGVENKTASPSDVSLKQNHLFCI